MAFVKSGLKSQKTARASASDALSLLLNIIYALFVAIFFMGVYFLIQRWREKVWKSIPLHMLNWEEIIALVCVVVSCTYLVAFSDVVVVQSILSTIWEKASDGNNNSSVQKEELKPRHVKLSGKIEDNYDEDIAFAVRNGSVASDSLESSLGDCRRAASVRRRAVELTTGRALDGLPFEGFDYWSIFGQCCELPVGYVQVPVGVVGPLLVDGSEYMVPMATTEGCLVASTNRGCKAIFQSGGASTVLFKDGMSKAPIVRFGSVSRTLEFKLYIEDPENFVALSERFTGTSDSAELQDIQCAVAGRNLYICFRCSTGDAMGMDVVSKGVERVLDYLKGVFHDMDVISLSGNFCADKKASGMNWIEGRGKSVVCEAVIKEEVVARVLKTSVSSLLELNVIKNLAGSAMAGAVGGYNAHASNIISAVFIATGQDPAQNVESSQCITLMELVNEKDLHVSVTLPCIEVGTVEGGTKLTSQAACLNMLGVKGSNPDLVGSNSQCLARIVAGAVLAGELSLMSALSVGDLVKSHMKYNRSAKDAAN